MCYTGFTAEKCIATAPRQLQWKCLHGQEQMSSTQSANSPAATCHPGQQGYLQSSVACASCSHGSITSSAAYCSFLHLYYGRSVAQPTGLLQELGMVALSEKWLLAAAARWRLHLLICFGMS